MNLRLFFHMLRSRPLLIRRTRTIRKLQIMIAIAGRPGIHTNICPKLGGGLRILIAGYISLRDIP
ncbi:hypothetical protein D3C75_1051540 [compost metagenome]